MDLAERDRLVTLFRRRVYDVTGFVPFPHQADYQLASEGFRLLDLPAAPNTPHAKVRIYAKDTLIDEPIYQRERIGGHDTAIVGRAIIPRVVTARVLMDMGGYKIGKSYGTAAWASGFGMIPGALIQFVGLEYGTSEPEFNYLIEFLCSDPPRGMKMKYTKLHNDKRGGRMILKLRTGATFEVKSWNQKEALKGAKVTAYVYTEAYQLPGLECYTTVSQNLRELQGFAQFSTTADRPWVGVFHKLGHGLDPDWHCTCGVHGRVNPFTFDQKAQDRDDPRKNGIMTKERYAISWEGKLGSFIGRVFDYQQGSKLFTPVSHPMLFDEKKLAALGEEIVCEG